MKINWKLRLKNGTTLAALVSAVIVFAYSVANALGIDFGVTQEQVMGLFSALLTVLAAAGVITDPTTEGVGDSEQALSYDEPKGAD